MFTLLHIIFAIDHCWYSEQIFIFTEYTKYQIESHIRSNITSSNHDDDHYHDDEQATWSQSAHLEFGNVTGTLLKYVKHNSNRRHHHHRCCGRRTHHKRPLENEYKQSSLG